MAGRGPAPKPRNRRVRRNQDGIPTTVVKFVQGIQPSLPDGYTWPEQTRLWWEHWRDSPLAEHFTQVDWDHLLVVARIHADLMTPGSSVSASKVAQFRQSVVQFGVTPMARAQLRIEFAEMHPQGTSGTRILPARVRLGPLVLNHPDVGDDVEG